MLAIPVSRFLAARNIHYGWLMVALSFGFGVCSTAALAIPGVLLLPISADAVTGLAA